MLSTLFPCHTRPALDRDTYSSRGHVRRNMMMAFAGGRPKKVVVALRAAKKEIEFRSGGWLIVSRPAG